MDTADTGVEDTGFPLPHHHWDDECGHVSAAELAGEEGGVSCSHFPMDGSFSLLSILIIFMGTQWFRRGRTRRTSAGR
jgi:hypothetical protein|tara:strand:- start:284 stop:517 length:234 start_codon:yes stop_codon:yes gene_type:complete